MTRNQRGCRGRGGDPEAVARDGAGLLGPASTSPVASQPQTSAGSTTATGHSSPVPAAASDTQAKPSHQSSPQLLTVHRLHCPFCLCHPPFYKTFLGSRVNRTTGEPEPVHWLRLPNCVSASQSCVNATALRAFQVHFARVHPGLNWKVRRAHDAQSGQRGKHIWRDNMICVFGIGTNKVCIVVFSRAARL